MTRACQSLSPYSRNCTVHSQIRIASLTRSIQPVPLNVLQLTSHQPQPIETIIQLTFQTANNFPFDKEEKFSREKTFPLPDTIWKYFPHNVDEGKGWGGEVGWGFSHSFLSHCIEMENIKSFILYSCFVFTIKEKPKKPFIEPYKTNIKVRKIIKFPRNSRWYGVAVQLCWDKWSWVEFSFVLMWSGNGL